MAVTTHAVHAHSRPTPLADPVPFQDLALLRADLRRARAELSERLLLRNSRAICRHGRRLLERLQPRVLAGYFGVRGEIDILPLLLTQARAGVRIAMPVLVRHRAGVMHFRAWRPGQTLCRNPFGIPEPCPAARKIRRREIDAVLLPLVGFDDAGNRLGMGGGYYDRYFSARLRSGLRRPYLVGIAHEFQRVAKLERNPWDVPLDAVITESGWQFFRNPLKEQAWHSG